VEQGLLIFKTGIAKPGSPEACGRLVAARQGMKLPESLSKDELKRRNSVAARLKRGMLAHVLVSKYCDHIPLYRQSQIFARNGVDLNRSTLANWVGGAAWWLEPLRTRLAERVFASQKLFADDTTIPVLDPGRGRTRTGRLWVYALRAARATDRGTEARLRPGR